MRSERQPTLPTWHALMGDQTRASSANSPEGRLHCCAQCHESCRAGLRCHVVQLRELIRALPRAPSVRVDNDAGTLPNSWDHGRTTSEARYSVQHPSTKWHLQAPSSSRPVATTSQPETSCHHGFPLIHIHASADHVLPRFNRQVATRSACIQDTDCPDK